MIMYVCMYVCLYVHYTYNYNIINSNMYGTINSNM